MCPQLSAPRGGQRGGGGLLPFSAHKILFHGTAEPCAGQSAAGKTLVRGPARHGSWAGSESLTHPKGAKTGEGRPHLVKLSPGMRAGDDRVARAGRPRVPVA